jgi:NADPH-dependent ferric siderophore reductase
MSSSVLHLHVRQSFRLSPSFQRVVVAGEDLERLPDHGYDHWFRMFFPAPGQDRLMLPAMTTDSWYQQWLDHPEETRPVCRNYTVRQFRRAAGELDIDFVLHPGVTGEIDTPAARWAVDARPGEPLGLLDQGATFMPAGGRQPVLLVGDETALPAIEGILRSLDPAASGQAIIEVPTGGDIRSLAHPPGVEVRWTVRQRGDHHTGCPGEAALRYVASQVVVPRHAAVFAAGESGLATGFRRHLVAAGHDKTLIRFAGYWKSERAVLAA